MYEDIKKDEATHLATDVIAKRIIGFILLALIILFQVAFVHQRSAAESLTEKKASDADSSVKYNIRQINEEVRLWTQSYPDTVVPTETFVGHRDGGDFNYVAVSSHSIPLWADSGNTVIVKPGESIGSYTICGYNESGKWASSSTRAFVLHPYATQSVIVSSVPCP